MKTLKRSRFYIFGNEETYWWKNRNGKWSYELPHSIVNTPWDRETDKAIIAKAKDQDKLIRVFTKKEFEEYMFFKNL